MRKNTERTEKTAVKPKSNPRNSKFHLDFPAKNGAAQKLAWMGYQNNDMLFMTGPAGTGKTYLAMAFAINDILQGVRKKIILTRPIVQAGEDLGYLPGTFEEKVNPYMLPLLDSIYKLVGEDNPQRDLIDQAIEFAPLAFLRGRTFDDSICIFDESQNATMKQLKLFLTRFGKNSKVIVTGDPGQSDIPGPVALVDVMARLESVPNIAMIKFSKDSIIRNPLITQIVERLGE